MGNGSRPAARTTKCTHTTRTSRRRSTNFPSTRPHRRPPYVSSLSPHPFSQRLSADDASSPTPTERRRFYQRCVLSEDGERHPGSQQPRTHSGTATQMTHYSPSTLSCSCSSLSARLPPLLSATTCIVNLQNVKRLTCCVGCTNTFVLIYINDPGHGSGSLRPA